MSMLTQAFAFLTQDSAPFFICRANVPGQMDYMLNLPLQLVKYTLGMTSTVQVSNMEWRLN
jgi:hypothetical protein